MDKYESRELAASRPFSMGGQAIITGAVVPAEPR